MRKRKRYLWLCAAILLLPAAGSCHQGSSWLGCGPCSGPLAAHGLGPDRCCTPTCSPCFGYQPTQWWSWSQKSCTKPMTIPPGGSCMPAMDGPGPAPLAPTPAAQIRYEGELTLLVEVVDTPRTVTWASSETARSSGTFRSAAIEVREDTEEASAVALPSPIGTSTATASEARLPAAKIVPEAPAFPEENPLRHKPLPSDPRPSGSLRSQPLAMVLFSRK